MTKVSVIQCIDYDEKRLKESIVKSLDALGGLAKFVTPGDRVLLKPNLLNGKPHDSCVTTHPAFVAAVAKILMDFGCTPVVGDSPPIQSCHKIAHKSGLTDELKRIGVELIDFTTPVKLPVGDDSMFKEIIVAQELLEADCVINLPKVKTHTQMVLTACVKNMFGAVIGKEKAMWHLKAGINKEMFAHFLLDLYYALTPKLTITDMIMTMEGDGPSSGTPRFVGAVVSGSDCVAMDTVICDILGIPVKSVYTLREAAKVSKDAPVNMDDITIICDSLDELKRNAKGFKLPKKTDVDFGLKPFFKRFLRDTLTSKPEIDMKLCKLCKACEEICPVGIMSISAERVEIDYKKCIKCFCCQEICPHEAVNIRQGFLLKLLG